MIKTPKNEILWVQIFDLQDKLTHVITSDLHRETYKLYQVNGDNLTYTKHKTTNPLDLEKYIQR